MGVGAAPRAGGPGPRPRVCLVVGQLTIGGLERQVYLLAKGLVDGPFDVTVVSMNRGGAWAAALRRSGVQVVELERRGRRDWQRLLAMRSLFRILRPRLVYSFNYEAGVYARVAGLLSGVPVLVAGERGLYGSRVRTFVDRLLIRFTECVICNAGATRDDLVERVGLPARKVITIPNAVEIPPALDPERRREARRLIGAGADDVVVGTIARLVWEKNLAMLVRVAARTKDAPVRLRYCIVGSGADEALIRSAIRREGLEDRITLMGAREDAPALLPGFDVFALTSATEGLPNTVMEAMAAGLPCVCTDVGGCRELVEDGRSGYLVPPADERAFAARVLELAADADRRAVMGTAGRARMSAGFSVEILVTRVRTLFLELLAAAGSRRRGERMSMDPIEAR